MAQPLIQRLCIIGVGLIGGSLARALKEAGEVGEVVGCGRNEDNLRTAVRLGVRDPRMRARIRYWLQRICRLELRLPNGNAFGPPAPVWA